MSVTSDYESQNKPAASFFSAISPMAQLLVVLSLGILPLLGTSYLLAGFQPLALGLSLGGYVVGALLTLALLRGGYPHRSLGLGNTVTLFRLAVMAGLLAPLAGFVNSWALVVIATFALILDGVDGWLAKRQGLESAFGARLDMEVDSALALVLALNVFFAEIAGAFVLLLGVPRYLFLVAERFFPWLSRPLPYSLSRRVICVVQVAALIGLNAPILPGFLILPVVLLVMGALVYSFGRDILWLWRSRP
jgi:phosphatidylglycerophosphate synthase